LDGGLPQKCRWWRIVLLPLPIIAIFASGMLGFFDKLKEQKRCTYFVAPLVIE
jgi:hypothetical protein